MTRRSFAEIVSGSGMNVASEYRSLHQLVFGNEGEYSDFYLSLIEEFELVPFRGTTLGVDDFNRRYGFERLVDIDESGELDDLLLLCEYGYSFAAFMEAGPERGPALEVLRHIDAVCDAISYRPVLHDGLCRVIPRDMALEEAALSAPASCDSDLLVYDWRGLKGDLGSKRRILVGLAHALEPKRKDLERLLPRQTSLLFFAFNTLDIRHNNTDPSGSSFKPGVAALSFEELEDWYDEVHRLCALCFLALGIEAEPGRMEQLRKIAEER